MLPMARQFQGFNGEVTQKTIDYFAERAKAYVEKNHTLNSNKIEEISALFNEIGMKDER